MPSSESKFPLQFQELFPNRRSRRGNGKFLASAGAKNYRRGFRFSEVMPIQLFDTLSREQRVLRPSVPDKEFGMYCCGPTVYGPAHIGNFRTFLLQDVLRRALEVDGVRVRHVRNLTDVDDKTIRRSQAEGKTLAEFTAGWTKKFHEDCAALNMLPPQVEPSAVAHIPLQIAMIEKLVARGNAYVAPDGSVYFKVSADPEYGKLARLDREALRTQATNSAGEANSADEYTRENVADFALWKARKPEDGPNFWKSPWGEGRPGWHIECSAMSTHYLGETFALHGGGVDLCFPHHENEIAQAECACGRHGTFAQHWFHAAHLMVDGAKMSKSLGNLYTLADIEAKGFAPAALRYALISGHYRSQLNFTLKSLADAAAALEKIEKGARKLLEKAGLTPAGFAQEISVHEPNTAWGAFEPAWLALCDDLNTPGALGKIFAALAKLNKAELTRAEAGAHLCGLAKILYALGLQLFVAQKPAAGTPNAAAAVAGTANSAAGTAEAPAEVVALAEKRRDAKAAKNWPEADRLRAEIQALGWKVLDRKDGYSLEKI